jgi:hypothetical protein
MSITYEVSADGKFVHTKMTGEVTEQDLVSYMKDFVSDERVKPGFSELIDGTKGNGVGLTEKTAEKIVEMNRSIPEKLRGSKCAMVIKKNSEFSLARHFEKLNKGLQTFIAFYNIEVAEKWLGCPKVKL